MAIRFVCPSCKVLIEIDDEWAGQSVACGNCRNIVTAPEQTTWSSEEVPTARPAETGARPSVFQTPPPPPYDAGPHAGDPGRSVAARSNLAGWGLMLAICAALAGSIAVGTYTFTAMSMAYENLGENASPEQVQKEAQRLMQSGEVHPTPVVTTLATLSVLASAAGVILAIRSLLRGESRRIMAIITIVLGTAFFACQFPLMLGLTAAGSTG